MKKRVSGLTLALTFLGAVAFAQEGLELRTMPTPGVLLAMAQTVEGHIWFGTSNGLYRYDGHNMLHVPLSGSTGPVRVLLASSTGGVWAATGGGYLDPPIERGASFNVALRERAGGLVFVKGLESQTVIAPQGTSESWVWSLAERPRGGLWVGTEGGLLECQVDGGPCARVPGVPTALIATLLPTGDDGVWMGKSDGLWRWSKGTLLHLNDVGEPIRHLARQAPNQVWALSDHSLILMQDGHKATSYSTDIAADFRVVSAGSTAAEMLVGSTRGLLHVEGQKLVPLPGELPTNSVRAILRDQEGSLWLAAKGRGVVQQRVAAVRHLGQQDGLPSDVPLAILREPSGGLLVNTSAGLARWNAGVAQVLALDPRAAPWTRRQLAQSSNGDVWLAWDDLVHSAARTGGSEVISFPSYGPVRAVHVDGEDHVWLGWERGGLARFSPLQLHEAPKLLVRDGLCPGSITHIVPSGVGGKGSLWLAGNGGISQLQGATAICRYPASKWNFGEITGLLERAGGTLWVTTVGHTGLMMAREQNVQSVAATKSFPDSSLYGLASDGGPYLWFSSPRGVFRAAESDLLLGLKSGTGPRAYHVDEVAGMPTGDGQAAYHPNIISNGRGGVFVSTSRTLVEVLAPESLPTARLQPVIDALLVDGISRPPRNDVTIPPQPRNVEIRFSAATFLARPRPALSYQLEGWDSQMLSADGAVTFARYAALPAGKYRFRLHATIFGAGGSSKRAEAVLGFTVAPAWHQRWPVRGLFGVLMLAGVLVIHRRKTAAIRKGYEAIHIERTRIARELHDGLAQFFTGLGLQLEALRARMRTAPEKADEIIADVALMTREAQAEAKRAIWGLRVGLTAQSVTGAIEDVVQTAREKLGIHVTSRYLGVVPQARLLEEELAQITREALTNAVRHGKATATHVELSNQESGLQLTIDDNGVGLRSSGQTQGLGIVGIRERANRCGGVATLTQRPQGGARVCVFIKHET